MTLSELIQQDHFASPAQASMLNIIVTSSWLMGEIGTAMAAFDITPAQYNVLRILRGSHPKKMTCSDIGSRLLDRTPDVTRLLNRLEKAKLIRRGRASYDRRVVEVSITPAGTALLEKMAPSISEVQQRLLRHLSATEHEQINLLLERLRTDQEA